MDKATKTMMSTNEKLLEKIEEEQIKRIRIHKEGDRNIEPNLIGVSNALDEYFILNKLKKRFES